MYAPRGHGLSEVGDVEVVADGDDLHLFHLTLPNHDLVQHAVSVDGLAWRPLPGALRTGDPGDCDDDQIWTASVTADGEGGWVMLYTALRRDDDGMVQRTAVAYSRDLIYWEKAGADPVAEADTRWYEADPATSGRVSWRDPKSIKVGDTWYATVCAREKDGPLARRGCVGVMASTNLSDWHVRPPLFSPRRFWDLECPQVFRLGGEAAADGPYYLTAAIMEDRRQRYWIADRFEGPYEVPADGGILAPAGHYAGRVCHWRGADYFFCWHRTGLNDGWLATPTTVDWLSPRNPYDKFVVPPLRLTARADGTINISSYSGWDRYHDGPSREAPPATSTLFRDRPTAAGWRVTERGGMDVLATADPVEDAVVNGVMHVNARAGGLAFRLDNEGGGYFIEIGADSRQVVLQKWIPEKDARDGHRETRYTEVQRGRLRQPPTPGEPLPFRLLMVGPYVELSLGDEVVLAELTAERRSGLFGIWTDTGTITVDKMRLTPMRRPEHG